MHFMLLSKYFEICTLNHKLHKALSVEISFTCLIFFPKEMNLLLFLLLLNSQYGCQELNDPETKYHRFM